MSQTVNASAQDDSEEQYYVLHDNQESELMTLDELDAAFQEERIHEETLVCRVGDTQWVKLRELADLDEEQAQQPAIAPAQPAFAQAPVYVPPSAPPARSYVPSSSATPSAAYAPVTFSAPSSVAPLAFDLDDLDENALRPKRRVGLVAAGIGILAAAGIAVAAVAGSGDKIALPTVAVPTVAAAAALTPSSLDFNKPKAGSPVPAAAPSPAPASDVEAPKATGRLTEDMKQALLAKDKERAAKVKTKAAAAPRRGRPSKSSSGPFRSGGSAYNPLNGKL